ncbi:MAG: hypothetical protein KIS92_02695 [Planctomycetota bacterium]|nr:hypothetical protein [Planctomycetota bacterium]
MATKITLPDAPAPAANFRGIGEVRIKEPISCVVEVLRRAPVGDGKWELVRPFTKIPDGAKYAFAIMGATTSTMLRRGTNETPAREPHPKFAAFNTCHPDLASTLPAKIVHWDVERAWKFQLGAYQAPVSGQSPEAGWWCRGDGCNAIRFVDGQFKAIPCPARKCEFQQERFGKNGDQPHCKPNLSLIAQFAWRDGSPLPRTVFQWDSKSWNNYGSLEGMFRLIDETAVQMKLIEPGKHFPVLALPFTLTLKETVKKRRKFPEVHASIEGDPHEWMQKMLNTMHAPAPTALPYSEPMPLRELPPAEMSQDDVDRASEAALNPEYRPANNRSR